MPVKSGMCFSIAFVTKPLSWCLYFIFKPKFADMGILRQVAEYLYLKKKDPDAPRTQWLKYMHGINRLSILLFLVAMIILAVKLLRK
jgi:hypothetical protein